MSQSLMINNSIFSKIDKKIGMVLSILDVMLFDENKKVVYPKGISCGH